MRAVVQRAAYARVESEGCESGRIGSGLMVLLGVETGDTEKDAAYMASKILKLRIFDDADGKMNLSVRTRAAASCASASSPCWATPGDRTGRPTSGPSVRNGPTNCIYWSAA